jgi:hypothetical protein
VRIRIRRAIAGIVDGVSLSHFVPGGSYDVSDSLGGYLVSTGDADAVPASAAVSESTDDGSDSTVFGGVIVANPLEMAADRPRPRRRRRSHTNQD